jgi:hypothetical protein
LDEQSDALSVEIMRSLTEVGPGGASMPLSASADAVGEVRGAVAPFVYECGYPLVRPYTGKEKVIR